MLLNFNEEGSGKQGILGHFQSPPNQEFPQVTMTPDSKWKKGKHASNYLDIEPNCFTCKYFHAVFIYTELSRAETTTYIQGHTLPFALNSLVHPFRKLCHQQQLLSWYLSDQDVHCVQHCSYSGAHFTISLSACVDVLCAWREGGIMLGLSTTDPNSWRFFKIF